MAPSRQVNGHTSARLPRHSAKRSSTFDVFGSHLAVALPARICSFLLFLRALLRSPLLTAEERLERHDELGQAMAVLQERLHPMIVYLIFERIIYMVCDVAVWRCRSAPFTLVHYVFRHIVRILGVALVIWRIGRLNASMYDDLTGKVVYQMMRCHSMYKTSENEEFKRKRWELEDWISYLRQNENGRRKYCLRVCSFQCCLRDHRVALWTVTIVFLPVAQKILSLLPQPSVS